MIVECEKCSSKFNLDESLLKEGGSKVRCSFCQSVFVAFPLKPEHPEEEPDSHEEMEDDFEETVALDSPVPLEEEKEPEVEETSEPDLDVDKIEALEEELAPDLAESESEEQRRIEEEAVDEELPVDQVPETEEEVEFVSPDEIPHMEDIATDEPPDGIEGKGEIEETEAEERAEGIGKEEIATEEPIPEAPKKEGEGRSKFWMVILAFLLLLMGAAIAFIFLAPDKIPDSLSFLKPQEKADTSDIGVRRLAFKGVKGSFIQARSGIQRFVIQGVIRNDYPGKRSFILVKGAILDDTGKVLKSIMVSAGNYFSEDQLKEMSLEEISKELKNRYGKGRVNYNIAPGETVPFMIVFENLPDSMSEFTVEAVRSSPAKKTDQ
jgi:predicted Zn finger-like uncharacterized protein